MSWSSFHFLTFASLNSGDLSLYLGTYSTGLVLLSIGIAIFASYTALLVADYAEKTVRPASRNLLLTLGGVALGAGIWSMHFVGMLGFSLPCGVSYDPWVTGLSMVPGVLASIYSLRLISQKQIAFRLLVVGGTLFGAGVGLMHYSGMAAMRMDAQLRYDGWLFLISIVVAVFLAILALWIRTGIVRIFPRMSRYSLLLSAMVMGGAVSGMHYTAMTAAYFFREGSSNNLQIGVDSFMLAIVIAGVTGLLIGFVLIYVFRQFMRELEVLNEQSKSTLTQLNELVVAQRQSVWIKDSTSKILAAVQGVETMPEFSRILMRTLTPLTGAQVGVLYHRAPGSTHYELSGSHAYLYRRGLTSRFTTGEGLIGQCVLERMPITISSLDSAHVQIDTGMGVASPRYLIAAPLIDRSGAIPAVIELATMTCLSQSERALLDEVLPMLATSIVLLERNQKTRELLAELQTQQSPVEHPI